MPLYSGGPGWKLIAAIEHLLSKFFFKIKKLLKEKIKSNFLYLIELISNFSPYFFDSIY